IKVELRPHRLGLGFQGLPSPSPSGADQVVESNSLPTPRRNGIGLNNASTRAKIAEKTLKRFIEGPGNANKSNNKEYTRQEVETNESSHPEL
ncbi:unnamed protein product, partial [Allacma fusca]